MNFVFITKIFTILKALCMESEIRDFPVELEPSITLKRRPRSFALFEEYSHTDIAETIRNRIEILERADSLVSKGIETKAETEISEFRIWLESVKKFPPQEAHYYSVSLKSLLIGLPIGVKIAQLFSSILENI
jgi:hypothetical protein